MTVMLGEYALSGAMLTALAVMLAAFACVRLGNQGLLRMVRWGMGLLAGLLTVSAWGLLKALLDNNVALDYVRRHSESTLPMGYKIAAFWAGQEGSLLLWAWLLGVIGLLLAWRLRKAASRQTAITLGVMAAVTGFFTCVMLFASNEDVSGNPFLAAKATTVIEGLNPILQNWMMVWHPPLLFLGYAAFTAPFALMIGALWSGNGNGEWLKEGRGWMVFAWMSLTVGIVLGSQWAYMVLGWGGYWGWDPVENASLLPWLTGTALLHSALLQSRRGMFKRWTAALTAASFFLCVFGTYLTRSGVVQSVHTFGDSPIGTFFLVFLCVIGVVSAGTILLRLSMLMAEHPVEEMVSREGFFLLANVLLSVITATVIVGTMFEKFSGWFRETPITVQPAFYNKVVLPMALVVAAMMATGPVLGFGAGALGRVKGKLIGMAGAGFVAAVAVGVMGYRDFWALIAAWTVTAVVAGIAIDLTLAARSGMSAFLVRPRHWGAQLAHLGLAAIVAGVAGSSLYAVKREKADAVMFKMGAEAQSVRVDRYTLSLKGLENVRRENHDAVVATIGVKPDRGASFELKPEQRVYDRGMQPGQTAHEVAIRFGVLSDLYLNLAGIDPEQGGGGVVTVEVYVNPLVNWIWVGGGLLALGGLVCLVPGLGARSKEPEGSSKQQEANSKKQEGSSNGVAAGLGNGASNGRHKGQQTVFTGRR